MLQLPELLHFSLQLIDCRSKRHLHDCLAEATATDLDIEDVPYKVDSAERSRREESPVVKGLDTPERKPQDVQLDVVAEGLVDRRRRLRLAFSLRNAGLAW